ncbi:MAG: hypothetical protein K9J17_03470 [Flavobacteriales bacterium]|nr:hypothetical protein [Flavobacteriales bacterium]
MKRLIPKEDDAVHGDSLRLYDGSNSLQASAKGVARQLKGIASRFKGFASRFKDIANRFKSCAWMLNDDARKLKMIVRLFDKDASLLSGSARVFKRDARVCSANCVGLFNELCQQPGTVGWGISDVIWRLLHSIFTRNDVARGMRQ